MSEHFNLFLFSKNVEVIQANVQAGVAGIIIDWENINKESRQSGYDTQINCDTLDDLICARQATQSLLICRINAPGNQSHREVEQAISAGVDEILVPMLRTPGTLETILSQVDGRCQVGILIETIDAIHNARHFARMPISRVYVGLNDLAIERRTPTIFTPLSDGTLEQIRPHFKMPFGFGGLTLPDRGYPIPCRLLIAEMVRLECQFSFLRRSYHRDIVDRDLAIEVPRILQAIASARLRTFEDVEHDRQEMVETIAALTQEKV